VLAHVEGINANLVGEHTLFDNVADYLRLRQKRSMCIDRDVAERVETKFPFSIHSPYTTVEPHGLFPNHGWFAALRVSENAEGEVEQ
jgi:hypothetical protein